jgi:6-pyruvoyltetrahydropterin/6-carboxytetrahydropterin synthase
MLVDLALLDRVLAVEVRERFDHHNINLDVPEFADGGLIPTGEEIARYVFVRVQAGLGKAARVVRVSIAEDATLSASYEG